MNLLTLAPRPNTALLLIVAAQAAGALVAQGTYSLLIFWKVQFALSQAGAGAIIMALSAGQMIALLVLGKMIDGCGERRVLGLSLLALSVACLLTVIVPSRIEALIPVVFLCGLFYAAGQPSGAKAIVGWFPRKGRGFAIGLHQAAVPCGAALSALLIPLISAMTGSWSWAAMVLSVVCVLSGFAMLICYRSAEEKTSSLEKPIANVSLTQSPENLVLLLGAGVAMTCVQFTFAAHGMLFFVERYEVGLAAAGALFALTQIVAVPTRIVLPSIVERLWPWSLGQAVGTINLLGIVSVAVMACLGPGTAGWIFAAVMLILGLFTVGWYPVYLLQVTRLVSASAAGRMVSLVTLACMVSRILGPPLFGLIVDIHGFDLAWACLLVPAALLTLPLFFSKFSPTLKELADIS